MARLEYWISFCRCITCQMLPGSSPSEFQTWTAKMSELLARNVVENGLDRRIREDPAVPVEIVVNTH